MSERFLAVAVSIAERLCRDAIWHRDRCTWDGWSVIERGEQLLTCRRSFGADLYRGTSGVCLFLSRLHRHVPQRAFERTIVGGLSQALSVAGRIEAHVRVGVHTGVPGVAHAALVAGELLDRPEMTAAGLDLLAGFASFEPEPPMFDVISGVAGAIPVFLDAAARHDRPDLADIAVGFGEFLLESAADMPGDALAWGGSVDDPQDPPLCGYSHGAAGVAAALSDLAGATGDHRFVDAAWRALRYERSLFDPGVANWPDLRSGGAGASPSFVSAWCHGAPGIGIARVRLLDGPADSATPGEVPLRDEVAAAIGNTIESLRGAAAPALANFSMCHGATGNTELLLLASVALGDPSLLELARQVGDHGIGTWATTGSPWPSGNPGFLPTPGLMLGDAGVGLFYLRLFDPSGTPSAACIGPQSGSVGTGDHGPHRLSWT